jgi:di- and tripeptidase
VIHPVLETDSGDLFSLSWSPTLQTIYFGCQNTSIQWFNCRQLDAGSDIQTESSRHSDHSSSFGSEPLFPSSSPSSVPRKSKIHKLFDSYPQYERRPADIHARNGVRTSNLRVGIDECAEPLGTPPILGILDVPSENVVDSAHYGYVYCMALLPTIREGGDLLPSSRFHHHLVTGSGDESIKVPVSVGFIIP